MIRNVTQIVRGPGDTAHVTCVDENLRYVRFSVPSSMSTAEHCEAMMHQVLDLRARTQSWRRNGRPV